MSQQYYGPAGSFSTDNPVSDQMQILAEPGPWDEEELWEEEDFCEVNYLFASCGCGWKGSARFFDGDREDFEAAVRGLLAEHEEESPDCKFEPTVG